jgi:hypothetical protein
VKDYLVKIDSLGRRIRDIFEHDSKCIIAGGFALSSVLFWNDMKSFDNIEIDVYLPCNHESRLLTRFKYSNIKINICDHATRDKSFESISTILANKQDWKKYDWNKMFENLNRLNYYPENDRNDDLQCTYNTIHEFGNINLIKTNLLWSKCCFASTVLDSFDMKQCQVCICSIKGTFFPSFMIPHDSVSNILCKEIEFTQHSFTNIRNQLKRIKKYKKRGFGLKLKPPPFDQ